jgi:hypothetical protein
MLGRLWRVGGTGSATLVTMWFAAWSGGSFGLVFAPGDNSPGAWAALASVLAAIAAAVGVAAAMLARPSRVAGRLLTVCVAAWAALVVTAALDFAGRPELLLMAAFEIAALVAVLPPIWRGDPDRPPRRDGAAGDVTHPAMANLAAVAGLFTAALVAVGALVAGVFGLIWAVVQTLGH